jgi:hypothetical protein
MTSGVDDAMPCLVREDASAENPSPERALRIQVGRVENDDLTHHFHDDDVRPAVICSHRYYAGDRNVRLSAALRSHSPR